jgi:hypothetical protein
MPFKPNYKFQRAERDRAKKAAKEAKLQERKDQAAKQQDGDGAETAADETPAPDPQETE